MQTNGGGAAFRRPLRVAFVQSENARPVTPEAAGSSPVDPANFFQFSQHVNRAMDRHGVPQGAPDQPGPLTQLVAHLQRLERELAAIEAARKSLTSQIREAKKTLESLRGRTPRGPSSDASSESPARRASASGALSQRPKAQS